MASHTFVCYARADADFVLTFAGQLKESGVAVWVDQWDVGAGEDWDKATEASLRSCAAFLIVLSPAAVESNEVRGELRSALNDHKFIVPVLYRACDIPRQLQNLQYVDMTRPGVKTDGAVRALSTLLRRRALGAASTDIVDDDAHTSSPSDAESPVVLRHSQYLYNGELRNRRDLLEDVRSEATARLAQTLPQSGHLRILMEKQPYQVAQPWNAALNARTIPRGSDPSSTDILGIFDSDLVSGKLLILGAPGGGKTTALLRLAHELTVRAVADPDEPLPVCLSLSSWKGDVNDLASWVVAELKTKYGLRKIYGRKWIEERGLIPLFDSLDEVTPEHQRGCLEALNQYIREHHPKCIVVCCRLAEYENLGVNLQLNGAVRLLPLSDSHIRDYCVGANCGDLWHSISTDPDSMELARSPLLLRMMTLAFQDASLLKWQHLRTAEDRRAYLFDDYLQHLLSREGASAAYSNEHTLTWLAWLADLMKEHGQEEFLIERLQPHCLTTTVDRWLYRVTVAAAVALIVGGVVATWDSVMTRLPQGPVRSGLSTGMLAWMWTSHFDTLTTVLVAVAAGLVVALKNTINPIETLKWSATSAGLGLVKGCRKAAVPGFDFGTYGGIAFGALFAMTSSWPSTPLGAEKLGVLIGIAAGAVFAIALMAVPKPSESMKRITLPRTMRGRCALMTGLVFGLGAVLTIRSLSGVAVGLTSGTAVGISIALSRMLTRSAAIGFTKGLIVGCVGWLGVSWPFARGPSGWFDPWLLGGLGVGTIAGVIVGGAARVMERSERGGDLDAPIEWRAFWRACFAWLVAGIATAAVSALLVALLRQLGQMQIVRRVALFAVWIGPTFMSIAGTSLVSAISWALGGAFLAGSVGALVGMLGAIIGADVERRAVPNQGIRQSAANIWRFAVIGIVLVGLPYSALNLAAAVALTWTGPTAADWVRMGLGSAIFFGLFGGLVPGAACVQHFALRFVLWHRGSAPWHYARFLNYATDRMLLQRVGGRYRFLHILLRDHFTRKAQLWNATVVVTESARPQSRTSLT